MWLSCGVLRALFTALSPTDKVAQSGVSDHSHSHLQKTSKSLRWYRMKQIVPDCCVQGPWGDGAGDSDSQWTCGSRGGCPGLRRGQWPWLCFCLKLPAERQPETKCHPSRNRGMQVMNAPECLPRWEGHAEYGQLAWEHSH